MRIVFLAMIRARMIEGESPSRQRGDDDGMWQSSSWESVSVILCPKVWTGLQSHTACKQVSVTFFSAVTANICVFEAHFRHFFPK